MDRDRLGRTLLLGVVLFGVSTAFFATVPRLETPFATSIHRLLYEVSLVLWWEGYALVVVGAVAVASALRRGAGRALALTFAGAAGVGANLGGVGLTSEPTLPFRIGWTIALALAVTVIFGGTGYLLGIGARLMAERS